MSPLKTRYTASHRFNESPVRLFILLALILIFVGIGALVLFVTAPQNKDEAKTFGMPTTEINKVLIFKDTVSDWKTTLNVTYEYGNQGKYSYGLIPIFETIYWCEYKDKPNRYERCYPTTE